MKYFLANIGVNLVALACVSIAGYMAIKGINGWGWFLGIGICAAGTVTFKETK